MNTGEYWMQKQKIKEYNAAESDVQRLDQNSINPYPSQKLSIKITLISLFAALAIGMSYTLAPLINIEVMSVILFIAGFLYGKYVGIFVGLISSAIYYGWNPFGVPALPIYIACVGCMTFIGFIGGSLKFSETQSTKINYSKSTIGKFAFIGFAYTLLFDILTNLVFAYCYYGGNVMFAFIYGFPFMLIHLISNSIIFALLVIPVYNAVTSI